MSPVSRIFAPHRVAMSSTAARSAVDTIDASSTTSRSPGRTGRCPRVRSLSLIRPRNSARLWLSVSPSAARTCAAFVDVVSPITRPAPASRQASASRATVRVFPVPAGADQDVDGPAGGQHAVGRLRLVIGQARAAQRRLRAVRRISAPPARGCAGVAVLAPQPRLDPRPVRAEQRGGAFRRNPRRAGLRGGAQQARLGVELAAGGVDLGAVPAPQAQPVRAPVRLRHRHHLRRGQQHRLRPGHRAAAPGWSAPPAGRVTCSPDRPPR